MGRRPPTPHQGLFCDVVEDGVALTEARRAKERVWSTGAVGGFGAGGFTSTNVSKEQ